MAFSSQTGQIADWTALELVKSRTGQLEDDVGKSQILLRYPDSKPARELVCGLLVSR